jgi:hypothetical protein
MKRAVASVREAKPDTGGDRTVIRAVTCFVLIINDLHSIWYVDKTALHLGHG